MTRQKKSPSVCQPTGKAVFKILSSKKTISPGSTRTNDPLINSQQAPDRGGGALERLAQYRRGRPKAQPPFPVGLPTDGESGFQDFELQKNQLPAPNALGRLLADCASPIPSIAAAAQDAIAALIRLAAAEAGAPVVEIGGVA